MDMGSLQIALLDNDKAAVHAAIDEIDRRTENEMFARASAHFGFETVEWSGRRIAYQGDLARVFGYSDASGLRKLADRYELEAMNMGWFGQNVLTTIREKFGLEAKTSRATFYTWPTFLVAGMISTTKQADEVKRYLLECERAARISVSEMARQKAIRDQKADSYQLVSAIAKVDRIKDPILRKAAIEQLPIDYPADARQGELPI